MSEHKPIVGIYKITSPSGRAYIGQSLDIHRRWGTYRKINNVKKQVVLYNSFLKYGVDSHTFEIIHICTPEQLNALEIYYGEKFNCLADKAGLNLRVGNANGKNSIASNIRNSVSQKNRYLNGAINGMQGIKQSDALIRKRVEARRGYKHSAETKIKIGAKNKGKKLVGVLWTRRRRALSDMKKDLWSKKTREIVITTEANLKKGRKGELHSSWGKGKVVMQFDLEGNYINKFISGDQAANSLGHKNGGSNIRKCCDKKTPSSYGYKWEYR